MNQDNNTITEMKISVDDLKIGMYVSRLDKPWRESSFLFQGFLIEDNNLIKRLVDECRYVFIDLKKGIAKKNKKTLATKALKKDNKRFFPLNLKGLLKLLSQEKKETPPNLTRQHTYHLKDIIKHKIDAKNIVPPKKLTSFKQEIDSVKQVRSETRELFQSINKTLEQDKPIDMLIAEKNIRECMTSMLRSPDAWLLMSHLSRKHHSIWQHSMNVSILAISLGRYLNLNDNELIILGLCGMLHDIGNLLISEEMMREANDILELKHSHTILGRDILLSCSSPWNEIVAEVAYSHHEFLNGTGFPRGLQGREISSYTRIITIVDLYDKLTTHTSRKKALTHYQAVKELLQQTTIHLDETLVESFIQSLGAFPVGCVVEMNTGELAVVVEENEKEKLKPKVVLLSEDKKTLDLANLEEGAESLYEITRIVQYNL